MGVACKKNGECSDITARAAAAAAEGVCQRPHACAAAPPSPFTHARDTGESIEAKCELDERTSRAGAAQRRKLLPLFLPADNARSGHTSTLNTRLSMFKSVWH
jgi:hypothetical protein